MRSKSFGLDIGTTSLKAVWFGKKDTALTLEAIVYSPISYKGILSDSIADQEILATSIKNMLLSAGITAPNANISLPESQVYTKILEMPDLSEQELQAALKWEIEQNIPLPIDQVRTDWQLLEKREKNGKRIQNILIVAAPSRILEKYNRILKFAGVAPQTIETELISVHRAFLPILNPTGSDVIVHLGASTTDVAITWNKVINLVYSIPLGGIAITRAISVDVGVDVSQAENFKRAYGLSGRVFEGKIGRALSPVLESIATDIKKGIFLFREKNNNQEIKQIILSGGSALLPGIDIFFTNNLGVQVVVGNAWQINNVANVPPEVMENAPSYNVVVGLAIRDLL